MPRKRKTRAAVADSRAPAKIPDGDEGADLVAEDKQAKLEVILKDFDVEINNRIERLEEYTNNIVGAIGRKLNMELLQIPPIIQKMKLSDFLAQGGVWTNTEQEEELDTFASQMEEKIKSKTKLGLLPIQEEASSEGSDKGKRTTRKAATAKTRKAVLAKNQSINCPPPTTGRSRRVMGKQQHTPAHGHAADVASWDTPLVTPKFSSKLPCTPATGLRNMQHGERVTLMSNTTGSPVTASEPTLLLPMGDQMMIVPESRMDNETKLIIEKLKQNLLVLGNGGGV